mmetsp:Transcript_60640/g.130146  ORF Transcript_60640/g.130146 Transcript_60640/m.130146 type:complete len:501 (-) Transcript_60640:185-1687(-)
MAKAKGAMRAAKGKPVVKAKAAKQQRLRKSGKVSLRAALAAAVKHTSSRPDIRSTEAAPEVASNALMKVLPKDRAGYPVKRAPGSVDPLKWKTVNGKQVSIDFNRAPWLPDDWAQGVKSTEAIARSKPGQGGTYTVFLSPDGRTFYHGWACEAHLGRTLGPKDGWNGQLRLAKVMHEQTKMSWDSDANFFKLLSANESKHLPKPEDLHFCIISARRASSIDGMKSIAGVQAAFMSAKVVPTWYVDEASLEDYRGLGLKAVVGGKLTPSRNKALHDAFRMKKACVQVSDDISTWEYRHGPQAESRDDDACNAAYEAAKQYVVSPVAAARFILAKMRGVSEGVPPKLGGVYMLGSCSRKMHDDPLCRNGFIIGDFFVADVSPLRFDEEMNLKEDYDFTCSHLDKYGSVMRLDRMTVSAKHYSNSGGAVTMRDKKGKEEQRNIQILHRKWPGAFTDNGRRKNEVLLKWGCVRHKLATEEAKKTAQKAKKTTKKVKKAIKKTVA